MKENLKTLSDTDPLTKLFNRRKVDEIMSIEFENHRRHNMNLSVCIFDIDDFKNINDTYGHDIGDKVLKEISNILRKNSRKTDSVARWGGEEFMIIMPHTNKNSALETIRKIKDLIKNTNFSHNDKLTCSFGISTADKKHNTIKSIFISADNNLYQAKKEGKDRIIF